MAKECRNVVLFIDNAPAHDEKLFRNNVKIVFLSPNTASHYYQLLDAGIIANFRTHYQKIRNRHAAIKYSSLTNNRKSIAISETKIKAFLLG